MLARWMVHRFARQLAEKKVRAAFARRGEDAAEPPPDERTAEPQPCDVALVLGVSIEADGLVRRLSEPTTIRCPTYLEHAGQIEERRIVVAQSGVGAEAARQATVDVIKLHQPQWVIAAGFAAGLRDELRRGHVLLAERVLGPEGQQLELGIQVDRESLEAHRGVHCGDLLSLPEIVRNEQHKRQLSQRFGALACDMETLAVAEACRDLQQRCLAVRVITDVVDDQLPRELEHVVEQESLAGKLGATARALWKRPGHVKALWKLKEDTLKASERLARFLTGVFPQLSMAARSEKPE